MYFLQGAKLWLLLGLINQYIKFETHPGQPEALQEEEALEDDGGVLTAQASRRDAALLPLGSAEQGQGQEGSVGGARGP